MSGPSWLAGGLAVLMVAVAAYCVARLAISRLRGKHIEPAADGLHVLMGMVMAGMLEPWLSPVDGSIWRAVFAGAAAWFAWQASPLGRARCAHPAVHAIECIAMVYMLAPVGSWPSGRDAGMPGMSSARTAGNPALTLVLALFMLGYVLWAADRLASPARAPAAATAHGAAAAPSLAGIHPSPVLAPRLAACYKIAMATTMGYMLVAML